MILTVRRPKREKRVAIAPKIAPKRTLPEGASIDTKETIQQIVKEEMKRNGYSRKNDPFVRRINNVITHYSKDSF
ncbi:hypothetical protein [Neobacillus sp. YIM B06451]|uniref:hypothetical protein n=1 Tax=Neobacillus sp. YIM B06451 TaxID=3070994 RepID=UPI002931741B|nr:hypothetical protein [Neobacillus sp. YIM B06451]